MCHNPYGIWYNTAFSKDFQLHVFNITSLKNKINLQKCYVQFATTDTKGRTLESCILYFCNFEDSHISQGKEKILMLVV